MTEQGFEFHRKVYDFKPYRLAKLYQNVDVAVGTCISPHHRAKDAQAADRVPAEEFFVGLSQAATYFRKETVRSSPAPA